MDKNSNKISFPFYFIVLIRLCVLYIINSVDFKVYKDNEGYLKLKDLQEYPIGDIEDEVFLSIDDIADRLWESYVADYWIEIN